MSLSRRRLAIHKILTSFVAILGKGGHDAAGTAAQCDTLMHKVKNLMGPDAVHCAECLSRAQSPGVCDGACASLPQGQELFWPSPNLPLSTACTDGHGCPHGNESSAQCLCCGSNIGMKYNLPPAAETDPTYDQWGQSASFKMGCDAVTSADNCQSCVLWRKLRGGYDEALEMSLPCTTKEQCWGTRDGYHTLMATFPSTDPAHYLVLPGSKQAKWPVIGVEDPQVLTPAGEQIFSLAWMSAFWPYSVISNDTATFLSIPHLPVSSVSCDIGIAINPASVRSQHQMHFHIARLPKPLRRLLVGRGNNFRQWTKIELPVTNIEEGPIAYAKYFALDSTEGPGDLNIFQAAHAFAGFNLLNLQSWGMMLIPDEAGIDLTVPPVPSSPPSTVPLGPLPQGVYVLLSSNNHLGSWNPFRQSLPNGAYHPETLLCTSWSVGAGRYWTQEDCPGSVPEHRHYTRMLMESERELRARRGRR